jgi:succinoglycan biosynthesis protein ExoM
MIEKMKHISVCICTYKRPQQLRHLLSNLEEQETGGLFDYSIVIVDNDGCGSARETAEFFARESKINIVYYMEPQQNIALARNKAVKNANGDFIAFIDDDEFPSKQWLFTLHRALTLYGTDGILGPVLPHFIEKPPAWVLKGRFFERPAHPSGYILGWENTRTGNVLLKAGTFKKDRNWFDPCFGSGGEDRDFFRRKISEGYTFAWCNEAHVFEAVPPERWDKTILMKRALIRGKMALNATKAKTISVLYSLCAVAVYTCCMPLFFVMGYHVFIKYLIKNCDHLGKILAFLGIDCVKEKYL